MLCDCYVIAMGWLWDCYVMAGDFNRSGVGSMGALTLTLTLPLTLTARRGIAARSPHDSLRDCDATDT